MSKSAILSIKIVSDAKEAKSGLADATSSVEKFQSKVDKLALPAAAIGAGAVAAGKHVIGYASEAEQAIGSVNTVFGKHASEVQQRAAQADQALGLSEAAYNSLASNVGGSLKAAGFAQDELGGKTDDLMTRAADLASVFGGDTTEATGAMGAALRGEFDSLERFGVFLNAAAVEAELARTGQDKLSGAALDAAKKQATYNLIMEQSADYAGNFAREADTAAGAEQRAQAARDNAAASIGAVLLPAYTALMVILGQVATFVEQNSTAVAVLLAVVAGLAGAVLATSAALRVYTAVTTAWTAITKGAAVAQKVLNAAMRANPIGIIITAVILLGTLFVMLYNRSETFRNAVQAAGRLAAAAFRAVMAAARALGSGVMSVVRSISSGWSSMTSAIGSRWRSVTSSAQSAARALGSGIQTVVSSIVSAFGRVMSAISRLTGGFRTAGSAGSGAINGIIGTIQNMIGWISSAVGKLDGLRNLGSTVGRGIRSLLGWQRHAPRTPPLDGSPFYLTAAEASRLIPAMPLRASHESRPLAARVVTVNVYGAIDPNRTARRIREILDDDNKRDGGISTWK